MMLGAPSSAHGKATALSLRSATRGTRAQHAKRARWLVIAVLAACFGCGGCATSRVAADPVDIDRFERVNRAVYGFNRGLDRKVVVPVARAYDKVVPPVVERRVRNFFTNLRGPTDILNNWLQGKFKPGFANLGRFLLNSTAGVGGFFDPAGKLGLERHAEDFGQTLAVWGVPSGGYLVTPLLGPGSFRDWGAWWVDARTDVLWQIDDRSTGNLLLVWRYTSDRAVLLPAERTLEESFDEYALVREAYFQRRRYQIFDEAPPEDEDYLLLETED
jgi:phospholipid-binding lipoprotein MlaA